MLLDDVNKPDYWTDDFGEVLEDNVFVYIDGTAYAMSLLLQAPPREATAQTYYYDAPAELDLRRLNAENADCQSYYFEIKNRNFVTYRLPEDDSYVFRTAEVGSCSENYKEGPSPTASPSITPQPTAGFPTHRPSVPPTLNPTVNPTTPAPTLSPTEWKSVSPTTPAPSVLPSEYVECTKYTVKMWDNWGKESMFQFTPLIF